MGREDFLSQISVYSRPWALRTESKRGAGAERAGFGAVGAAGGGGCLAWDQRMHPFALFSKPLTASADPTLLQALHPRLPRSLSSGCSLARWGASSQDFAKAGRGERERESSMHGALLEWAQRQHHRRFLRDPLWGDTTWLQVRTPDTAKCANLDQ